MRDEPLDGLGLSAARRLERIERTAERTAEMVGDLGNKVDRANQQMTYLERRFERHDHYHLERQSELEKDMDKIERRFRSLDLRFYGILAGLITAAGYVLLKGGVP